MRLPARKLTLCRCHRRCLGIAPHVLDRPCKDVMGLVIKEMVGFYATADDFREMAALKRLSDKQIFSVHLAPRTGLALLASLRRFALIVRSDAAVNGITVF